MNAQFCMQDARTETSGLSRDTVAAASRQAFGPALPCDSCAAHVCRMRLALPTRAATPSYQVRHANLYVKPAPAQQQPPMSSAMLRLPLRHLTLMASALCASHTMTQWSCYQPMLTHCAVACPRAPPLVHRRGSSHTRRHQGLAPCDQKQGALISWI